METIRTWPGTTGFRFTSPTLKEVSAKTCEDGMAMGPKRVPLSRAEALAGRAIARAPKRARRTSPEDAATRRSDQDARSMLC